MDRRALLAALGGSLIAGAAHPQILARQIAALTAPRRGSALAWDPAVKPTNANLTAGSHIVTASAGGDQLQRANTALVGRKFWERTVNVRGAAFSTGGGICDASAAANGQYLGFNVHNGGMYDGGQVWFNNTQVVGEAGIALAGQTCVDVVDTVAQRWWTYVPSPGAWCGSAGSDDPLTGTGGLDITGMSSPIYPMAALATNGDQQTINGGSSPWANPAIIAALLGAGFTPAG